MLEELPPELLHVIAYEVGVLTYTDVLRVGKASPYLFRVLLGDAYGKRWARSLLPVGLLVESKQWRSVWCRWRAGRTDVETAIHVMVKAKENNWAFPWRRERERGGEWSEWEAVLSTLIGKWKVVVATTTTNDESHLHLLTYLATLGKPWHDTAQWVRREMLRARVWESVAVDRLDVWGAGAAVAASVGDVGEVSRILDRVGVEVGEGRGGGGAPAASPAFGRSCVGATGWFTDFLPVRPRRAATTRLDTGAAAGC